VDDQGRHYFVVEVPRQEGAYRWLDEARTRVRLRHGVEFDVASHDDQRIRVKIYRPAGEAAPAVRRPEPGAEERARVAASYRADVAPGRGLDLAPFGTGLPARGQWRNGFDVADMNGDGHPDIVFGPRRKGRAVPTIFLGDGRGRWRPWVEARFPALPYDYGDARVADLNGDGHPDLVLASHLRGIVALVGDGRGRYTAWSEGIELRPPDDPRGPAFGSRALAVADWNGDGRPDILALGEGPILAHRGPAAAPGGLRDGSRGVVVHLNRGDGTWTRLADRDSRSFGGALAVADFDRDGRLDFVAGSDRMGSATLLGLGRPDGTWEERVLPALRPAGLFRTVAVADFDRDGRPDVAVGFLTREAGTWRAGIDVLLNRPAGWERRTLGAVEGRVEVSRLATGDLDGDGHADLVGVDGDGALWIFRGDGHGGFTREPVAAPGGEQCRGYGLRLADLDRDGADEIVASFAEEPVNHGPYGTDLSCPSEGSLQAWKIARTPDAGR
jgi:hypothetical protein